MPPSGCLRIFIPKKSLTSPSSLRAKFAFKELTTSYVLRRITYRPHIRHKYSHFGGIDMDRLAIVETDAFQSCFSPSCSCVRVLEVEVDSTLVLITANEEKEILSPYLYFVKPLPQPIWVQEKKTMQI